MNEYLSIWAMGYGWQTLLGKMPATCRGRKNVAWLWRQWHFSWWHVKLVMSHHIHSYLFIYKVDVLWHSSCHNENMWQSHVTDMSCVATSCVSKNALRNISCRRHSQLSWQPIWVWKWRFRFRASPLCAYASLLASGAQNSSFYPPPNTVVSVWFCDDRW